MVSPLDLGVGGRHVITTTGAAEVCVSITNWNAGSRLVAYDSVTVKSGREYLSFVAPPFVESNAVHGCW